jgi:cell division transport system permease protein
MRLRSVLSEVWIGLRRNLTMTIAVILTVAVSLALFGTSLLVRAQVSSMKDYWYDRVEVSLFLCNDNSSTTTCPGGAVTDAQRDQIRADLQSLPVVETIYFESKEEAFQRFQEQFKGSPILDNVTADVLPESFRIKLKDPTQYSVIASAFTGRPGVDQVQDQRAVLDKFFSVLNYLQNGALLIAVVMLVVLFLLVVNTIRVAAFNRRRETGIMRLVGASNLYIQTPFLAEAAIAALVGSALAVGVLVAIKGILIDQVVAPKFTFNTSFFGWDAVINASIICVLLGVGLSVIAAFFTLRKYLRV